MMLSAGIMMAQGARQMSVSGQIVDSAGHPAPGSVEVDSMHVATSQDGTFRVSGLAAGRYVLITRVPGFKNGRFEIELESGRNLELPPLLIQVADMCGSPYAEFSLLQSGRAGALKGAILIEARTSERFLSNLTITLLRDGEPVKSTITDRAGRFAFEGLETGDYTIVARGVGVCEGRWGSLRVQAGYEASYSSFFWMEACVDAKCTVPRPRVVHLCE